MKEKQLVQLLQFVLIWVLLWLFVVFVKEESFVDFVLKYWLYLLVVSVSYFYYYSIQYEPDKKYKLIRNVLISGNVYLFLHIFFRPLLNISHQLFVLLGLIFLGLWRSSKLKSRWKYLLQILGGIVSFFILISGMFYLYPESPDINGFISGRAVKISFLGVEEKVDKKEAYIQLVTSKGTINLDIAPNFSRILSENQKVLYLSMKDQRDEKIMIITQYGDLLWVFPQTEVQLEFDGETLRKISKIDGKILFFSGVFDSDVEISGHEQTLTQEQQEWLEGVQNAYRFELVSYLKKQISENNIGWANNTIMYDIDGKIVGYLAKIFPVTFGKNLDNYREFKKYFSGFDEGVDLGKYNLNQTQGSEGLNKSFLEMLQDNMNLGTNNIYGLFRKPKNE